MLFGENVRLAQWGPADAPLLTEWMNDPAYWGPYYNVWGSTESEWEAELATEADVTKRVSFVIRSREDDRPLGTIGYFTAFGLSNYHRALEIWYQMHPAERGRGVATEAAAVLANHLFSALPIERVQATVVVGNDGSCAVLEKIGMTREGLLRQVHYLRGRYVDMHLYSLIRGDWKSEDDYVGRFEFLAAQA